MNLAAMMSILNGGGGNDYNASCSPLYPKCDDLDAEKEEILRRIINILYLRSRRKKPNNSK